MDFPADITLRKTRMKFELTFKVVLLFSYQGFVLFFFNATSLFYHFQKSLSRTFFILFLPFFNSLHILAFSLENVKNFFCDYIRNGEEGIWTLAPLLTTYSLSRRAPSASWVLLQIRYSLIKDVAERVGFEPTDACASPVFKTGSFNRSDISPSWKGAIRRTPDYYTISIGDLSTICSHFYFFNFFHFRGCISRNSMLL